jgi:uncharacterized protein YdhG (YjbR/CyaY superfamily)
MKANSANEVEEYIRNCSQDIQLALRKIRSVILNTAPSAVEKISYGMPAYQLNGKPLVYFGAFKNHIGLFATPTGHDAFKEKLNMYKQSKGGVQFPKNKPVPFDLIQELVALRVQQIQKIAQ